MNLKEHIEKSQDYNLYPGYDQLNVLLDTKPLKQWKVDLPETTDYKQHRLDVVPPLDGYGAYVVVASVREDFAKEPNLIQGMFMVISDLVMVKREEGKVEVDILSGETGEPVSGVDVFLYQYDYNSSHKVAKTIKTDAKGTVSFSRTGDHSYFLFAQKGDHISIDPNYLYFYTIADPVESKASLIYTDRSIYRPLQKIQFKIVLFKGRYDLANYKTLPGEEMEISLMDANYQIVEKKTVTTNNFGTASGEFSIPSGKVLGQWQIQSTHSGYAAIRVEEYKRPTFEASFKDPKNPLKLNQKAVLEGEVLYYFGQPVTEGTVSWQVNRTPLYPWWYYWYSWSAPQTIKTGVSKLDADGVFLVEFVAEADENIKENKNSISYNYTVTAEVTDEGGETRTATRTFRLGFVSVEASVSKNSNFFLVGESAKLTVRRTNLNGIPVAGAGTYRVLSLNAPEEALLPVDQPLLKAPDSHDGLVLGDDKARKRWQPDYLPEQIIRGWEDGQEFTNGTLAHDDNGVAEVLLDHLPAGAYRLYYSTIDDFGETFTTFHEFTVVSKKYVLSLPAFLTTYKNTVKVGETAKIFVGSGLPGQLVVVDIYRNGKRLERKIIKSGKDKTLIEIPVTEELRGGFYVTSAVLSDYQFMFLQDSIYVPWDNKELKVEFSTFRDLLRPGGKETWSVKITGPASKETPVKAAEVLAYMYDRSLDLFTPHYSPSPMSFFQSLSRGLWAYANVGGAHYAYFDSYGLNTLPDFPYLSTDSLNMYFGYGIGGMGYRGMGRGGGGWGDEDNGGSPVIVSKSMIMLESDVVEGALAKPAVMYESKNEAVSEPEESNVRGEVQSEQPATQVRTNFSETAFFYPHLITGDDGTVSFEFTVPDSVTSWNVWVQAITRDLESGAIKKEVRTVKDLMVRPYLPRFLREGDRAELKMVVNNASEQTLSGQLTFDIIDPVTEESLLSLFGLSEGQTANLPFSVEANSGTNLSIPVITPNRVGPIAFKVTATSGNLSDGELRPIPVLPGRMHLSQSRFVSLRDKDRRVLTFDDLKNLEDNTLIHEQMVVTVDAQLFYSVLSALPYLVDYPYECTEQTLNRFLSTGILSSMYKDYPAIEKMAKKFSERDTQYEQWNANDPNRKMALEETPWLQVSQGGKDSPHPLLNVLDPQITRAQRDGALKKLSQSQTSLGGFPWFSGGPPSPYMTLYLLYGFSKAMEFGVAVPEDMIWRAWEYLHRHYLDEVVEDMLTHDCCWEFITFLNYTLSNYPATTYTEIFTEEERETMLDFSFGHWKHHSPYLKSYLALTLNRMNRHDDAMLVWESVMDSAKTEQDMGTYWAPEDRGWLWYNDSIETHALAIRTILELEPESDKMDGLVLWILLNKKLNHWKSTKATSEVLYSLAYYMRQTKQLGVREEISVQAGKTAKTFVFLPDEYTGKNNQIVIPGEQVTSEHSEIVVEKEGKGLAFASATWHFSTEKLPDEARGDVLSVTRTYFKRVKSDQETVLIPLAEGALLKPGDEVEVHMSLTAKHPMEYVHMRDPRPAGFEPVSFTSTHKWNLGIYWYEEIRDSGTNFFFEHLPQGEFPFKYRLRASVAGIFKAAPTTVQPMYAPEFTGYSSGSIIEIKPSE